MMTNLSFNLWLKFFSSDLKMRPKFSNQANQQSNNRITTNTINFEPNEEYSLVRTIGNGTFGAVFEVVDPYGNHYAVKKVVQDPHYKNRELDTLNRLNHPNCMRLIKSYYTREGNPSLLYLHIVSDIFPTDLYKFVKNPTVEITSDLVRIFSYQIFSALHYLHQNGICHRDMKPTNVLVDPPTGRLQLCDFGSAKPIRADEDSVSYIATRSYRAPELLFGCKRYSFPVDIWAAGCIISELVNKGRILFSGQSNDEMIRVIMKVLGPPTAQNLREYGSTKKPSKSKKTRIPIKSVLESPIPDDLADLLEKIFVYSPSERINAYQCLNHPFFEPVRSEKAKLPNGEIYRLYPQQNPF
ncbi:Glycogen synthase kinase 3 [Tritrichomonas foetus]|uniref:Glycogen synthase kinase 3 n=1 Tax=Tritrichomonas foetus TaxID=1144522 RepID=A0A1J4KKY0_9EUKA|nr:Glycogen synthase kinase 3 [Tritrichomonas foetus]|eukprot:OHT11883.1 Glycogen synthase kinase 3 [Tritrichomonas foetus]